MHILNLSFRPRVILSVLVLMLIAAPSWATLQCGDTIGPTASVILTHDLNCSGFDPALTIEGPATLIMLGHTLDCQDANATGIQITGEAAIVQQGTVMGCKVGVAVGGTGSHVVTKMHATANETGIGLQAESHGNSVTENYTSDNTKEGIRSLGPTNKNEFRANKSTNDFVGIVLVGNDNTVKENFVKNSTSDSYQVVGSLTSNNNLLIKNRAIGGGGFGILLALSNGNTLLANIVKEKSFDGIHMAAASETQVIGNKVKKNAIHGIQVTAGSFNNVLLGNIALGNTVTDLFDGNPGCDNNQWVGNRFGITNQGCIQ